MIDSQHEEIITKMADLVSAVKSMDVMVNRGKIKYTVVGRKTRGKSDLIFGNYIFHLKIIKIIKLY